MFRFFFFKWNGLKHNTNNKWIAYEPIRINKLTSITQLRNSLQHALKLNRKRDWNNKQKKKISIWTSPLTFKTHYGAWWCCFHYVSYSTDAFLNFIYFFYFLFFVVVVVFLLLVVVHTQYTYFGVFFVAVKLFISIFLLLILLFFLLFLSPN